MSESYELAKLSPEKFQELVVELATAVLGQGVTGFPPGPDGGRDASFEGKAPYPSILEPWDGKWYFQSKFHAPSASQNEQKWLLKEIKKEIKEFTKANSTRKWPDNWIIATNIDPSGKPETGAFDKARKIVRDARIELDSRFHIWGGTKILTLLAANPHISDRYAQFLTTGNLITTAIKHFNELREAKEQADGTKVEIGELRCYLTAVAEQAARLSQLFPERLRRSSDSTRPFENLRQRVRVFRRRTSIRTAGREDSGARGQELEPFASFSGKWPAARETEREEIDSCVWNEELACKLRRAVILADPGFGKTWLLRCEARRVALVALELLDNLGPDAVEIPIYCRLPDIARDDDDLDQALTRHVCAGRSVGFRHWLRARLAADRCVVLMDALDEVPEERPSLGESVQFISGFRQKLRQRIETFANAFPRPRVLLTSRIFGYSGSPIPAADELELLPFGPEETEEFVSIWFDDDVSSSRRFLHRLKLLPDALGLARVPLMLQFLCRTFERSNGDLPVRRVELYGRCILGMLSDWKGEKQGRQIGPAETEPIMDVLSGIAFLLFKEGYEQFDETQLLQHILTWQQKNLGHMLSAREPRTVLQEFQNCGIVVRSGDDPGSPWLFLHRTFLEYLTARALARKAETDGWRSIESFLDRVCWLPDWNEVTALLAGELAEPEWLLKLLADKSKDDFFRHRLALAARCLSELAHSTIHRCTRVIDLITEEVLLTWWDMGRNDAHAAVSHLERNLPSLPPMGKVQGHFAMNWLCEKFQREDARHAEIGLTSFTNRAATSEILSGLLTLFRNENSEVRQIAARATGRIGSPAATPEIVNGLIALLDESNLGVLMDASQAVGQMGAAAAKPPTVKRLATLLRHSDWPVPSLAATSIAQLVVAAPLREYFILLLDLLRDTDSSVRRHALHVVLFLGNAADKQGFIAGLVDLFKDTSPTVRESAAESVGLLGNVATRPEVLVGLIKLMDDTDSSVRKSAAKSAGSLGNLAATPDILAGLRKLFNDTDANVRQSAVKAVGSLGNVAATPEILAGLVDLFNDSDPIVRKNVAETLGSLQVASPEILNGFLNRVRNDPDRDVLRAVLEVVAKLGVVATSGETLTALLDRRYFDSWNYACHETRVLVEAAMPSVPGILQSEDKFVRATMAILLGDSANRPEILSELLGLFRDSAWEVRRAAASAVHSVRAANVTHELVDGLSTLFKDPNADVQIAAAFAASKLGSSAATPEIVSGLLELSRHEFSNVRASALRALGSLGTYAMGSKLQAGLFDRFHDADPEVRTAAPEAVGELRETVATHASLGWLHSRFGDSDRSVRCAAINAIGRLGPMAATPEILDGLFHQLRDTDGSVRSSAARTVAMLKVVTPQIFAELLRMLRDWSNKVDAAAAIEVLGANANIQECLPLVLSLFGHEDPTVRMTAIKATELLGSSAATPEIVANVLATLHDSDIQNRREAASVLQSLFSKGLRVIGAKSRFRLRWVEELARESDSSERAGEGSSPQIHK